MVENTWGTRFNFLNGATLKPLQMISVEDGQKVLSDVEKLSSTVEKMAAIRPGEAVSAAGKILRQCTQEISFEIDRSMVDKNSKKLDPSSSAGSDEIDRGPSFR